MQPDLECSLRGTRKGEQRTNVKKRRMLEVEQVGLLPSDSRRHQWGDRIQRTLQDNMSTFNKCKKVPSIKEKRPKFISSKAFSPIFPSITLFSDNSLQYYFLTPFGPWWDIMCPILKKTCPHMFGALACLTEETFLLIIHTTAAQKKLGNILILWNEQEFNVFDAIKKLLIENFWLY